jgi:hypothetical protein
VDSHSIICCMVAIWAEYHIQVGVKLIVRNCQEYSPKESAISLESTTECPGCTAKQPLVNLRITARRECMYEIEKMPFSPRLCSLNLAANATSPKRTLARLSKLVIARPICLVLWFLIQLTTSRRLTNREIRAIHTNRGKLSIDLEVSPWYPWKIRSSGEQPKTDRAQTPEAHPDRQSLMPSACPSSRLTNVARTLRHRYIAKTIASILLSIT